VFGTKSKKLEIRKAQVKILVEYNMVCFDKLLYFLKIVLKM